MFSNTKWLPTRYAWWGLWVISTTPTPLSAADWRLIQAHPVKGDEILTPLKAHPRLRPYVRWHHEKLDGSGYPDGLTEIPLLVQVLSAADMYDALTSRRTYREAVKPEEALEALEREAREGRLALEAVRALRSGLRRGASEAKGHVLHL